MTIKVAQFAGILTIGGDFKEQKQRPDSNAGTTAYKKGKNTESKPVSADGAKKYLIPFINKTSSQYFSMSVLY